MNCDGVRGLLSAYVDGELSAGELLRVEQHLRRCHWCADEVDALRQTIALVASLEEVEVPLTFQAQLHERLVALGPPLQTVRTAQVSRARRQDFRRWATPAAAAAAALVIGVAGLNRINTPTPVQQPVIGEYIPSPSAISPDNNNPSGNVASNPTGPQDSDTAKTTTAVQKPSGSGIDHSAPPEKPVITDAQADPAAPTGTDNASATGGTVKRSGVHTATTSFMISIPDPGSLPVRMQYSASVTATSADVTALADLIAQRFAGATRQDDKVSGKVELSITVPNAQYASELKWVEQQTGAPSVDFSLNLGKQIADAYDLLRELEAKRLEIEGNLKEVTDLEIIEPAEKDLAQLKAEADQAREDYQLLTNQIANGTISVTLKPSKAQ